MMHTAVPENPGHREYIAIESPEQIPTASNMDVFQRPAREDLANWLTHGLGFLLSLVGAVALLLRAAENSTSAVFVACLVYSFSASGLYLSSMLSHKVTDPPKRAWFRMLDQAFIYLMITGSFTPFTTAFLNDAWWNGVIGFMWSVSIFGFVSKIFFAHRVEKVAVWFYLLLGWTPLFAGLFSAEALPAEPFWSIVIGGAFYTGGTFFLFNDQIRWYFHAIWHLFVIAGSAVHFFGIYCFVCAVHV